MECLECQRLTQQTQTAHRAMVSYSGPRDGHAFAKLEKSDVLAQVEYEVHRDAAHPESIDERLAG
jgi:hypothetical protein